MKSKTRISKRLLKSIKTAKRQLAKGRLLKDEDVFDNTDSKVKKWDS